MSKCKSCGADIEWVKTKEGNNIPLNPELITIKEVGYRGWDTIIVNDKGETLRGKRLTIDDLYKSIIGAVGRVSHFATCPNADMHRKIN